MDKSTKVKLIKEYYSLLGQKLKWDSWKVRNMCEMAHMELAELAALLRMTEKQLAMKMRRGFSRQDSLLLYQIAVNKGYYQPVISTPND